MSRFEAKLSRMDIQQLSIAEDRYGEKVDRVTKEWQSQIEPEKISRYSLRRSIILQRLTTIKSAIADMRTFGRISIHRRLPVEEVEIGESPISKEERVLVAPGFNGRY